MPEATTIVVEVRYTGLSQDWPEVASLLCLFLRRTLALAREQGTCFPFRPGKCVQWGGGGSDGRHANGDMEGNYDSGGCGGANAWGSSTLAAPSATSLPQSSRGQTLGEPPAVLWHAIATVRVCDLTDPDVLATPTITAAIPSTTAATAAGECHTDTQFVPICFNLAPGGRGMADMGDYRIDESDGLPSCTVIAIPHATLEGMWESLSYGESQAASTAMKRDLLEYVHTALIFSAAGVDPHRITWNRMVLLHGPPGTGKTSLCKALAHKLAVRLCDIASEEEEERGVRRPRSVSSAAPLPNERADAFHTPRLFARAALIEVNAHSLFSRWFSESGKQVMQLFERVRSLALDPACLVCVLMDEVESLAAARQSAMKGNEPSDSIRVVNALLTQLDSLQHMHNVLVLATSNLTGAIDVAFLDRADKKVYVGPPGLDARQAMLQSAVAELLEKDLVHFPDPAGTAATSTRADDREVQWGERGVASGGQESLSSDPVASSVEALNAIATACAGLNGRLLKKLPFLAYGACISAIPLRRRSNMRTASVRKPGFFGDRVSSPDTPTPTTADTGSNVHRKQDFSQQTLSIPVDELLRALHRVACHEREVKMQLDAAQLHGASSLHS